VESYSRVITQKDDCYSDVKNWTIAKKKEHSYVNIDAASQGKGKASHIKITGEDHRKN
jgi:hypothetical protein